MSKQQVINNPKSFQDYLAQGLREGALILLVAISIFLMMALASYTPTDPAWTSTGHTNQVSNYGSRAGAWFADVLRYFLGYVSYLIPLLFAHRAWTMFRHRHEQLQFNWPLTLLRIFGFILTVTSATALLALYSVAGLGADSGGVLGRELADRSMHAFNLRGSTLIWVSAFLFGVTVMTGLSWFRVMDLVGAWTMRLARKLAELARRKPEEEGVARAKSTARVQEKPPVVERVVEPSEDKPGLMKRLLSRAPKDPDGEPAPKPEKKRKEPKLKAEPRIEEEDSAVEEAAASKKIKILPFAPKPSVSKRVATESQPSLFDSSDSPLPPLSLLDAPDENKRPGYSKEALEEMSRLLEIKLQDFGVAVEVVEVNPGPVITRFEIRPAPGVKVSRISNLAKDLARSLAVVSVRVVEVIPGKSVVGIEIPNEHRQIVRLKEVLSSQDYADSTTPMSLALGNDIAGNPMVVNLAKMPHLLVAGTTGSGKSVGVNAMLLSLLFKATPKEVRLIMIDPKMLELSIYDGIPHLLAPVVTDMKEAANALRWCVGEMERRYRLMASMGVRNIIGYNRKIREARDAGEPIKDPFWKPQDSFEQEHPELDTLPYIVVVIDEFADMMMIVGKKVEELIARIAQKARAAGIHLILATQRPSVDVITGLIKANIPTRIAFQVSSKIDSRTILDQGGAEQLLGHGDMLYMPPGTSVPHRVHGAFVDDAEVHRVVDAWKERGEPDYIEDILEGGSDGEGGFSGGGGDASDAEADALYDQAVAFVTESRKASISAVQRRFKIGYNRAANLVEAMEAAGVVSPPSHNGAREVLAAASPRD